MKQKTPQEKKTLSYAKDRRNDYGANDKASRKSIPLRKANQNRAYRKKVNQILDEVETEVNLEKTELLENLVRSVKKGSWKKYPDAPLGEVVEAKIENRKRKIGKGKTARQKEREFIEAIEIKVHQKTEEVWVAEIVGFHGLKTEGRTEKEAVGKVKTLAKVAAQNAAGLDAAILIDGKFIKPILEKKVREIK